LREYGAIFKKLNYFWDADFEWKTPHDEASILIEWAHKIWKLDDLAIWSGHLRWSINIEFNSTKLI
jgi:hypothetical protein